MIDEHVIQFLKDISENNNREWFQEHKNIYQETHDQFRLFIQDLRSALIAFDEIEKTKVYRFYRDLRFSKDKTPYKTHYAAHFTRKGKFRRGGFYFQVSAQEAMVAGGFWNPEREDLLYIREGILAEADVLRKVAESEEVMRRFGGLSGDELQTAPRGFDRDHPDIDLLRKKQFLLLRTYPVTAVMNPDFHHEVAADFQAMIPVFDVLTDYLIYDGNGEERE